MSDSAARHRALPDDSEPQHGSAPDDSAPAISIVAGNPTPEELAAVTAVIVSMLEEIEESARHRGTPPVSAWQRSQRSVRAPLSPGAGSWRSFSG